MRSGGERHLILNLVKGYDSSNVLRDIRNAPVALISGQPSFSNSTFAMACLLAKCIQTSVPLMPIHACCRSTGTLRYQLRPQDCHRASRACGHRVPVQSCGKLWASEGKPSLAYRASIPIDQKSSHQRARVQALSSHILPCTQQPPAAADTCLFNFLSP